MKKKRVLCAALLCLTFHLFPVSISGNLYNNSSAYGTSTHNALHVGPLGIGFGIGQYNGAWRGWKYLFKSIIGINCGWKRKNIKDWNKKDCLDYLESNTKYNLTALSEQEQIELATQYLEMYTAKSFHDIVCNLPIYKAIKSKLISYLYRVLSDDTAIPCGFFEPCFYPKELPYLSSYAIEGIKQFLSKEGIKYAYAYTQNSNPPAQNIKPPTHHLHHAPPELENQINALRTEKKWEALFQEDQECLNRLENRRRALIQSNAYEIYSQIYATEGIQDILASHKANLAQCKQFNGTPIQHVLHSELLDIIRNIAPHKPHQELFTEFLIDASLIGIECNQHNCLIQASNITDWCWSLWKCYRAMAEGVQEGISNTVDICMHPMQTIQGLVPAVKEAGYVLFWLLEKHLRFETMVELGDWEAAQRATEPIYAFWSTAYEEIRKKPKEDYIGGAATMATQTILMGKLLGFISSSIGKACSTIKEYEQLGRTVATTSEGVLLEVAAQAETLFIEGDEFRSAAEKLGRIVLPTSSRCLLHSYIEIEKKFLKMIEPLQEYIKKIIGSYINGADFEHCLEGTWSSKNKRVTGGHALCNHPERLGEITKLYPNGIIESRWNLNGKSKFTTAFPEDWDPDKLCNILAKSLKDIRDVEYGLNGLTFTTKYSEISIKFCVNKEGIVTTFFPIKPI